MEKKEDGQEENKEIQIEQGMGIGRMIKICLVRHVRAIDILLHIHYSSFISITLKMLLHLLANALSLLLFPSSCGSASLGSLLTHSNANSKTSSNVLIYPHADTQKK